MQIIQLGFINILQNNNLKETISPIIDIVNNALECSNENTTLPSKPTTADNTVGSTALTSFFLKNAIKINKTHITS